MVAVTMEYAYCLASTAATATPNTLPLAQCSLPQADPDPSPRPPKKTRSAKCRRPAVLRRWLDSRKPDPCLTSVGRSWILL